MAEPKDPRDDEHIEELLSQLQGIFGKLSRAEEEESREKIDPPMKSEAPAPTVTEAPPPTPVAAPVTPAPSEPAVPPPVEPMEPAPGEPEPPPPVAAEPPASPNEESPTAESSVLEVSAVTPEMLADKSAILAVVCYPSGRETEIKTLGQKLETMAPKFTKVAFQLKVTAYVPYNPKSEWYETVLSKITAGTLRALFILVERPMDDAHRKAMIAALEPRGIYFQDVPLTSVDKKAFYTDLLLGMVFFFDSLKQTGQDAGT